MPARHDEILHCAGKPGGELGPQIGLRAGLQAPQDGILKVVLEWFLSHKDFVRGDPEGVHVCLPGGRRTLHSTQLRESEERGWLYRCGVESACKSANA